MKHQRCPNLQMWSPVVPFTNAQDEKSPFISILSWYDGKEQLRRCTLLLPRLVLFLRPCTCSSSMEGLAYSPLWGPAPCASALPGTLGKHRQHKPSKHIPAVFGGLPWQHTVDSQRDVVFVRWIHTEICPSAALLTKSMQLYCLSQWQKWGASHWVC